MIVTRLPRNSWFSLFSQRSPGVRHLRGMTFLSSGSPGSAPVRGSVASERLGVVTAAVLERLLAFTLAQ